MPMSYRNSNPPSLISCLPPPPQGIKKKQISFPQTNPPPGYSAGVANALSAPPAILAMVTAFFFAWVGDKYTIRAPIIALQPIRCRLAEFSLFLTCLVQATITQALPVPVHHHGRRGSSGTGPSFRYPLNRREIRWRAIQPVAIVHRMAKHSVRAVSPAWRLTLQQGV